MKTFVVRAHIEEFIDELSVCAVERAYKNVFPVFQGCNPSLFNDFIQVEGGYTDYRICATVV
jgi:hypothetical protein